MANDNRLSRRVKDEENNASNRRNVVNGIGSSSSTGDTSGLRRSTRETSSKIQLSSSPSSTRKSERLEKQIIRSPLKKKPEKGDKERLASPLRRSDRGKTQPCSSSSDLKRRKLKTEKSIKKLDFEEEEDKLASVRKSMKARSYLAGFKQQIRSGPLKDTGVEMEKPDTLSQVDSSNKEDSGSKQVEGGVDECSARKGVKLTDERISEEDLEISNSSCKKFDGESLAKRKRNTPDMDSAVSSPSHASNRHNDVATCITCFKRRRVGNDAANRELCSCNATSNKDSCDTFSPEDRVELDASVNTRLADNEQNTSIDCSLGEKLLCFGGKGCKGSSHDNISKLKKKLTGNVAYDGKSDSSRFIEYWVPVWISNVQLEKYCATLLSNSYPLSSTSRTDCLESLHEILSYARKCCDHPYLVEPKVRSLLIKDLPVVEFLDVEIKASGKLQLLDLMLSQIKDRQLRVVIIYQSIGCPGNVLGNILEDFLRDRFGPDSYEHVIWVSSKKQAALNKFNEKDSKRFVFLIEKRACLPSIKLRSLDTIIIFDSDWSPTNDLRALLKMSLESDSKHIKVFRLYSSGTVEEQVLKCDLAPDCNLRGISRSTSHTLLMWGASYLFKRLEEFHGGNNTASSANIKYDQSLLEDVAKEFSAILSQSSEDTGASYCKISKVQHIGGSYIKKNKLLGETTFQLPDGEPHVFWTKLLEGRNPRWNYPSGPSQRNRKRVQYYDHSSREPDGETEVGKKRKKVVNDNVGAASLVNGPGEGEVAVEKGGASAIPGGDASQSSTVPATSLPHTLCPNRASTLLPEVHMVDLEKITIENAQRSLRLSLKPEISKLSEVLQLSEDVKAMVGEFLEYVIHNHDVSSKSATILQAFQISLCWTAASILKQKINRKESLVLAKQHLNFDCKEEEVNNVYSRLRELKKDFLCRADNFKGTNPLKDSVIGDEENTHIPLNGMSKRVASKHLDLIAEDKERSQNKDYADHQAPLHQDEASKIRMDKKDILGSSKQVRELSQKQQKDIDEVYQIWECVNIKLNEEKRLNAALIRSIHSHGPLRTDKLKKLDDEISKKVEQNTRERDRHLENLAAKHLAERNEEGYPENELSLPGSEMRDNEECSQVNEHSTPADEVPPSIISETATCEARGADSPVKDATPLCTTNCKNYDVNAIVPERGALEMTGNATNEVEAAHTCEARGADSPVNATNEVEAAHLTVTFTPVEPNSEDIRVESNLPNDVQNLSNAGGDPSNDETLSGELSIIERTLMPPAVAAGQGGQSMPIQQADQSNLLSVQAVEYQPCSDRQTSVQSAEAPLQTMEGSADNSNQAVTSPFPDPALCPPAGTNDLSVGLIQPDLISASGINYQPNSEGGSHLLVPTVPHLPPLVTTRPSSADPLQNEWERLQKESEQVTNVHEEMKLHLRFNCDKEIDEAVSKIRSKYEAKLQNAESAYLLRKKDLEMNQFKVCMNKRLADAFKSKLVDLKAYGTSGMQKNVPSSSMRQNLQQQQHTFQPTTSPRPTPVISSSTVVAHTASSSQHCAVPPPPPPPPVQASPATFPSMPTRPLQISSITLPSGNPLGREIRSPAPHLQPFRPATGIPSRPHHPHHGIPSQQQAAPAPAPHNMPTTSQVVLPQHPFQPPSHHHSTNHFIRPVRPEIAAAAAGGSPAFQNPGLSAVEAFLDSSTTAVPYNNLPPLPELNFNFGNLDLSEFGGGGNVAPDVVCLSDDD